MRKLTDEVLREAVAVGTNAARRYCHRRKMAPYGLLGVKLTLKRAEDVEPQYVLAMKASLKFLGISLKDASTTREGK